MSAGRAGVGGILLLAAVLVLTGCAAPAPADHRIRLVASTDVWGSVAAAVGAGRVHVISLIEDPSRDPHDFQATARDQLAVSRADVVVENGGGYDDFMRRLVAAARPPVVLDAVRLSGYDTARPDFNEHVWYDLPTVRKVANAVSAALVRRDPAHRGEYAAALDRFGAAIAGLAAGEAGVRRQAQGRGVAVTEPVPLYLTAACGLVDRTPAAFSTAIDDGRDVAPAVLEAQLRLVASSRVALLAVNEQAVGPTTDQVVATARRAGLPVVGFRETLPPGASFVQMFHTELAAVRRAVDS